MRVLFLGVTLSFLLLAAAGAWASDVDHDLVPDDLEDRTERVLAARGFPAEDPTAFYTRSEARDGADAFEVDWSDGATVLSYLPDPAEPPALRVTLQLLSLSEFEDRDGNGLPGVGEARTVVALQDVAYRPGGLEEVTLADGARALSFTVLRPPLAVRLDVGTRFRSADSGTALSPVEVGIRFLVDQFSLASRGSGLALQFRVSSEPQGILGLPPGGAENTRLVTAARQGIYLAWDERMTADGNATVVVSEAPAEGPGPWVFTVVYPWVPTFEHALRLGVLSTSHAARSAPPPADVSVPVFFASFAVTGVVVAATVWARRR